MSILTDAKLMKESFKIIEDKMTQMMKCKSTAHLSSLIKEIKIMRKLKAQFHPPKSS